MKIGKVFTHLSLTLFIKVCDLTCIVFLVSSLYTRPCRDVSFYPRSPLGYDGNSTIKLLKVFRYVTFPTLDLCCTLSPIYGVPNYSEGIWVNWMIITKPCANIGGCPQGIQGWGTYNSQNKRVCICLGGAIAGSYIFREEKCILRRMHFLFAWIWNFL